MPDTLTDMLTRLPVEVRTEFEEFKARRPDLAAVADALIVTGASIWSIFPLDAALPPRAAASSIPAAPAPAGVSATPAPPAAIEMLKTARPELAAMISLMAGWNRSLDEILAVVNSYSPNPKAAASTPGWDAAIAQVNKTVAQERGTPSQPAAVYPSPLTIVAGSWDAAIAETNRQVALERGTHQASAAHASPSAAAGWDEAISEVNAGVAKQPGGSAARNRSFA